MADTDSDTSLRVVYERAQNSKKAIEGGLDWRSEEYETALWDAITDFEKCRKIIADLTIFSINEGIEEVSTADIKYLQVDYDLAEVIMRNNIDDRRAVIRKAQDAYKRFLKACDDYDLLSGEQKKLYEKVQGGSQGSVFPTDVTTRREAKIAIYRQTKEIESKMERLKTQPHAADEDITREIYLSSISLAVFKAFETLDSISQEMELLARFAPAGGSSADMAIEADAREKQRKGDGYSEKLDDPSVFTSNKAGPLLSKEGKPLRPFTLVDRKAMTKDVFKSGHNLPTMSIDEYLEEERRRGNIIEGGGEKSGIIPEPDLDDEDKVDEATYKARAWDEFTEENPKGAGNTMNRG